jgi:hypothetical protein
MRVACDVSDVASVRTPHLGAAMFQSARLGTEASPRGSAVEAQPPRTYIGSLQTREKGGRI